MINFLVGILIMASMTALHSADTTNNKNLSHEQRDSSLQAAINNIVDKVKNRQNLPYVTVEKQLELINLPADFGLGRFLLERGGLNGYWTDYVIKHPGKGRLTGLNTEWKLDKVDIQDVLLQKIIFVDILDCKWQVFRAEETIKSQLRMAGFDEIEIIYDNAHIFPTVVARKPL